MLQEIDLQHAILRFLNIKQLIFAVKLQYLMTGSFIICYY